MVDIALGFYQEIGAENWGRKGGSCLLSKSGWRMHALVQPLLAIGRCSIPVEDGFHQTAMKYTI